MTPSRLDAAVEALVQAHRTGMRIDGLPEIPESVDEAHAIQDAVVAQLGEPVGAYKAATPADAPPRRGLIPARMVRHSPALMAAADVPQCGVEAEVAFRFLRDLPQREQPYGREEVAAVVSVMPAIEVLSSRFREPLSRPRLEQLADNSITGGLVLGPEILGWSHVDLAGLEMTLAVNGETVLQRQGAHPTGDPLGVAVALVNMMRLSSGVKAGQAVATGSWSGMMFLKPGDRCTAAFTGLGVTDVTFTA